MHVAVLATGVLERSFFAVPADLRTPSGELVNAVYGLISALRRVLAMGSLQQAVVLIDAAGCSPSVEQVVPQHAFVERVARAHGFPTRVVEAPGEVAAALASRWEASGDTGLIVGCDKRLAQLVSERVRWLDPVRAITTSEASLEAKYGVLPSSWPDYLALVGDDALEIPGVRGIGPAGAAKLLRTASLRGWLSLGKPAALAQQRVEAEVGLRKATLEPGSLPAAPAFEEADPGVLNALYRELGFTDLLAAELGEAVEYFVVATTAEVGGALAELVQAPVTAVRAVRSAKGSLLGLAAAAGMGRAFYFPWTRLEPQATGWLSQWLGGERFAKVAHQVQRERVLLAREGVALAGALDTAESSWRAMPEAIPHDLDQVCRRALGQAVQLEVAICPSGELSALPEPKLASYACHLADRSLALHAVLPGCEEPALSEVLAGMELRGMALDLARLQSLASDLEAAKQQVVSELHALAHREWNPASPQQVAAFLYDDLDLPRLARTKNGWSTASHVIDRIEHPAVSLVLRFRQLNQLAHTWVEGLTRAERQGRVHPTFHTTRSLTGRIITTNPDMSRTPSKTHEHKLVRSCFRPGAGRSLLAVDYNQLELRLLAHLSGDPALLEPLGAGEDLHAATAEALGVSRKQGKTVNFASFYGQGAAALALQLGVEPAEARRMLAAFNQRYEVARAWQQEQVARAKAGERLVSLAGREQRVREVDAADYAAYGERLAARWVVQASASDLVRSALVAVDAAVPGSLVLVVHDELLLEVETAELALAQAAVANAMLSAAKLALPLEVGCRVGTDWGGLKPR